MKCPVVSFEVSMILVWLLATCILMLRVLSLHCWRISLVCLALKPTGSWVELGFSVGMEAVGWALIDECFLESKLFQCSQVLDLSLLPLVCSLILTVASRLLHSYSTDDKTSRLMVKRFSTVRDTQRGWVTWRKEEVGLQEIEVTRRRRGGIKRGDSNPASNQLPICSPQSGTLRDVHGVTQRRESGGRR